MHQSQTAALRQLPLSSYLITEHRHAPQVAVCAVVATLSDLGGHQCVVLLSTLTKCFRDETAVYKITNAHVEEAGPRDSVTGHACTGGWHLFFSG